MGTTGDRIKHLREAAGLTQEYLARKLNTTKQTIYKYENNIVTNIPPEKVEQLARALKTSPAHLMGWDREGDNLKSLMTRFGVSTADIANKTNMPPELIRQNVEENNHIDNQILSALAELSGADFLQILRYVRLGDYDPSEDPSMHGAATELVSEPTCAYCSAPLYEAAAGEGRVNEGYPSETYSVRLESDEAIVQVSGRSMEPTLLDGDKVIVAAQSVIDYPRQIALVKVNGDDATLKRVEKKDNGLMLLADNVDVYSPHFYTIKEIEELPVTIEGVVTRLIREMK